MDQSHPWLDHKQRVIPHIAGLTIDLCIQALILDHAWRRVSEANLLLSRLQAAKWTESVAITQQELERVMTLPERQVAVKMDQLAASVLLSTGRLWRLE